MKRKYEIAVLSRGGFARTVRIYAPKKADRAIIMHDGQNLFEDENATYKKSWRVLDALKAENIKNTAIIGIDSQGTREYDYLPFPCELKDLGKYHIRLVGGRADEYMAYITEIIIPYLDKRFNYKFYGMLGSSAGGLATLYFAAKAHSRFKAYGIFSAPLFVSPNAFKKFFDESTFDKNAYYKVYTGGDEHTGDVEKEYAKIEAQMFVTDSYTITDALRGKDVKDLDLTVTNTGVHDELSWRAPEREFFKKFSELA
ncbi:MAG: hypothetical protein J1F69_00970 [Clostridiales bacterium]|nr:hypothetical protein [Clostridiales bacterium]